MKIKPSLRISATLCSACAYLLLMLPLYAQQPAFDRYHTPAEINAALTHFATSYPQLVKIHTLAKDYSGNDYRIAEIGTSGGSLKGKKPAVMVVANMEGTTPLASEAALFLIRELVNKPSRLDSLTWYVLPCGNPEGALHFFNRPLTIEGRNPRPWNDDMDELTDEDGPDDLNGDGLITQMRVREPEGTMIPDDKDPRLMKRADPLKGERGQYKIYPEGIDNDGDGRYNEDGPGGTNLGITLPFLYGYNQPGTGAWSGSEPPVYALMQFMQDHSEIAMTMTYGSTNFCLSPPKGAARSSQPLNSIKLPQRYVQMLNADPDKTYTLDEVKEMMKAIVPPGTIVDDAMVAGMLDMGPVTKPLDADAKLYTALAEQYRKFLKERGMTSKRLDPQREKDGTFEIWSYYQLGLPSFSMDLWALPKPKDSLKNAFQVYNDSILKGTGFISWREADHPKLGKVEIGGIIPYADQLPLPGQIDSLLTVQVPWIFNLVRHIPELTIEKIKSEPLGSGVYRIEAWIRNTRMFPFPLAIGQRTKVPRPAIVTLTGKELKFLSGRERTPLEGIGGYDQRKLTWILQTNDPASLIIRVNPVNAYGSEKSINPGGK